jgi:hypothetical protein
MFPSKTWGLTADRLKEVVSYDPETGIFTWREGTPINLALRGAVAGGPQTTHGYWRIGVDGRRYPAHRLAWLYVTGNWPQYGIDHIDGNRLNNKFSNLRDATAKTNNQNQRKPRSDNTTGFLGVSAYKDKFFAYIKIGRKVKNLGVFRTAEEAHTAYVAAKREHHAGCTI